MQRQATTLTLDLVTKALVSLLMHYPEAGHNSRSIGNLARDYHEDLTAEGVKPAQFSKAVSMARRRCRFFPKVAEILSCVAEIRQEEIRKLELGGGVKQLEVTTSHHDLTPEERERNKARAQVYEDLLCKKITAEEATEAMEALGLIAEFGGGKREEAKCCP